MSGQLSCGLGQQAGWDRNLPGSNCPDKTRKRLHPSVCLNCGKEGHYASRCLEGQQLPLVCFSCGEEGHIDEGCTLGRVKVCQRCGEEGHYSNQCITACPNCDEDHLPENCPTVKVTCFLCEGSDHYPKECSMSLVITRSLKLQRLLLRSSTSFAIANASKPEKFLDDLSEELQDRLPVYTFPDFQLVVEDPIVAGSRKRKRKGRRKCQEKTQGDASKVANVTCFCCNLKGHYANHCPQKLGATSRFFPPPVIRSHVPAKHPDWTVVYNPVHLISAEKAQDAPGVV